MVPISGFANSIVSAALEFKREGMVYGIGSQNFYRGRSRDPLRHPLLGYHRLISYIGGYYG